eukprot:gnl/TRDRNA2_/TRDRNA2_42176_c0_seq1.p1 gnl/TRDRNA2_/TRDRNA2_42176_c0~~gnl/TRDRNA2_/TRDRNA2_42176_c0_seq1.p1  ORF type:complete len:195 (+),score=49.67 gnl/TRDRNA2_/TRDRNA2_42176_c0_seq1:86-670(+)
MGAQTSRNSNCCAPRASAVGSKEEGPQTPRLQHELQMLQRENEELREGVERLKAQRDEAMSVALSLKSARSSHGRDSGLTTARSLTARSGGSSKEPSSARIWEESRLSSKDVSVCGDSDASSDSAESDGSGCSLTSWGQHVARAAFLYKAVEEARELNARAAAQRKAAREAVAAAVAAKASQEEAAKLPPESTE